MGLRLYMDEHVPAAVTAALSMAGIDVLSVQQDGHVGESDAAVLARACELERVVVTQDEDFLRHAHAWQNAGRPFTGVIYAHQLRMTIGQFVADLHLLAVLAEPGELAQRVQYLPLR
ncbi:MAG: DUF5615 family PIN-like protein [Acidobacteria bacterium]|nr:DUF5615 family PIN-like protein [Acidobacteriota bacterium]